MIDSTFVNALMSHADLKRVRQQFEAMRRLSIRLQPDDRIKPNVGSSKFGGQPDLPPNFEWARVANDNPPFPQYDWDLRTRELAKASTVPLPFVAQIRLEEIAAFDLEQRLPASGMLYFFAQPMMEHLVSGQFSVQFCEEIEILEPRPYPNDLASELRSQSSKMSFFNEWTLPSLETSFVGLETEPFAQLQLTEHEWKTYNGIRYENRAHSAIFQMLGYSDDRQPYALENSYAQVRKTLFSEHEKIDLNDEISVDEYQSIRLLLQISGLNHPDKTPVVLDRFGDVYFFICNQDFKAQDFSRIWATEQ
jgi:uncharacterized protein YwqG